MNREEHLEEIIADLEERVEHLEAELEEAKADSKRLDKLERWVHESYGADIWADRLGVRIDHGEPLCKDLREAIDKLEEPHE